MDTIVGRIEEQKTLNDIYHSNCAELIKSFFEKKECMFFNILGIRDGKKSEQIYEFTRILESTFYQSILKVQEPKTWTRAFELLTQTITQTNPKGITVLFFDELPWLAGPKSGFIQALDYYWNRFWVNMPNIKLIVCGSAASWMIDNILHDTGGLHNRITNKLPLDPFNLKEVSKYLEAKQFRFKENQVLELYMMVGGIPYYLNYLDKKLSIPQNIDQLFFHKNGKLLEEFNILYSSLFKNSEAHEEIVRVVASKREGIERTELLAKLKLSSDGGTFEKRIRELIYSGFIIEFQPYNFKKKGSYYRVIDEYSLFYFDWVEPHLATILRINKPNQYWLEHCQTPAWRSWSGYAFEAVCFKHIEEIRKTLKINASAEIGNWRFIPKSGEKEEGVQIYLLFDRNDKVVTLCEIKYSQEPYKITKQVWMNWLKKAEVFEKHLRLKKQIVFALISPFGVKESIYSEELIGVVTLKELMN